MKTKMGIEGVGPKIVAPTFVYLIIAFFLNRSFHSNFIIANNTHGIEILAVALLIIGLVIWIWPVVLLLNNYSKGKLIISGPFILFLHPIYDSYSFFLLPALALYLNSWIFFGAPIILFIGTLILGKKEEEYLSQTFGEEYNKYRKKVVFKF